MASVQSDVLEITYLDIGERAIAPVILLHGWPDAARSWTLIANALVAAGRRVLIPDLRGSGNTRFLDESIPRDGTAVALATDALDLADALQLDQFAVVGHDWGARTAYTLAALVPQRLTSITALALAYQPRGRFTMPNLPQAQRLWYQWLMYVDAGVAAIAADPVAFARRQWDTWSPPGWFDEAEFAETAKTFRHPDWVGVTLTAYRSRFRTSEPLDPRYDDLRTRLDEVEHLTVPTMMIQGASDFCDAPEESEGLDEYFDSYRRILLDGVGHFPHREAPTPVAQLVLHHLNGNN
jgi:pimeloyl-ACP methyl ester carboxylesterase